MFDEECNAFGHRYGRTSASQDDNEFKNVWSSIVLESCIHGIEDFLELGTASSWAYTKCCRLMILKPSRYIYVTLLHCLRSSLYTPYYLDCLQADIIVYEC
jgi:hypothetical protein